MLYYHNSSQVIGIDLAEHPTTLLCNHEWGWDRTHSINMKQIHPLAIRIDEKINLMAKYIEILETAKCKTDKDLLGVSYIPIYLAGGINTCKLVGNHCRFEIKAESSVYVFSTKDGLFGINPLKNKNEFPSSLETKKLTKRIKEKMIKTYPNKDGDTFSGFLPKWEVENHDIIML